jgi:uncharacterized protein (DUF3084 family)
MFDIIIKELHTHNVGVECVLEKLADLEANLKEKIMTAKDEILGTVAAETQEVLDKIAADRAEIDAAKAELATAQAQLIADQAELAAKTGQINDLQAQLDALIAGGNTLTSADLVQINDAIKSIINP